MLNAGQAVSDRKHGADLQRWRSALALGELPPADADFGCPDAMAALRVQTVSNRADLVSGGEALVAVTEDAAVTVDGRDVTSAFARRPGGAFAGLVTGLGDPDPDPAGDFGDDAADDEPGRVLELV